MNHFHFASHAVDPTIAFYETYFGFRQARVLGKTHVLVGDHGFLLAIDEGESAATLPKGSHLGFTLESPEKVHALFRRMAAEGVAITSALVTPSPRASHFYCLDPSGQPLEVGWYDLS
jgi:catechol 2,3-dioxygenase-like lactoylglutathione lyase family enzyme